MCRFDPTCYLVKLNYSIKKYGLKLFISYFTADLLQSLNLELPDSVKRKADEIRV